MSAVTRGIDGLHRSILFPARGNGGPRAQPAARSLLFLFDAFNGECLKVGVLVADFFLQAFQDRSPTTS